MVNALGLDPLEGKLLDPHNGQKDLEARILRHVGPAFAEDPLRVLRAMQFIARFDLTPAKETTALCRRIPIEGLPSERIYEEWKKLILKGRIPSKGLDFLKSSNWLGYFPELQALVGCEQEPEWHPPKATYGLTHCIAWMRSPKTERVKIGKIWSSALPFFAMTSGSLPLLAKPRMEGSDRRSMKPKARNLPVPSLPE